MIDHRPHARRAALGLLALLVPTTAVAQEGFAIDDTDPVSSVPSQQQADAQPMQMAYHVMGLSERAVRAEKSGLHHEAAQFYRAIAKATPNRAAPFGQACAAHQAAGEWTEATAMCRAALAKQGAKTADVGRLINLLANRPAALTDGDVADADAAIAHAEQALGTSVQTAALRCQLAARLEDDVRLQSCVSLLRDLSPGDPQTLIYGTALALQQKDWDGASALVKQAGASGMSREVVERLRQSVLKRTPSRASTLTPSWSRSSLLLSLLAGALAIATVLFARLRRAREAR